jgi:hypothetical protein
MTQQRKLYFFVILAAAMLLLGSAAHVQNESLRWMQREIWRRGGIATVVAEREVRMGERWYVSCFQRGFTIRRNRQCLCES